MNWITKLFKREEKNAGSHLYTNSVYLAQVSDAFGSVLAVSEIIKIYPAVKNSLAGVGYVFCAKAGAYILKHFSSA